MTILMTPVQISLELKQFLDTYFFFLPPETTWGKYGELPSSPMLNVNYFTDFVVKQKHGNQIQYKED